MVKKYYCDFRRTLFVAVMALAFVGALGFFGTVYAVSGSYTDAHSNVVQWDLDTDTGVMDIKVKGTASDDGAIIDFDRTEAPWYPYEKSVKEVNIGTGIKWLGGSTFLKYEYLEKATIKGPEAEISDLFFGECWWLQDVVIPSNDDVYIVTTSEMDEDGNWQDDPMYDGYDEVLGPFSGCDFYVLEFDVDPDCGNAERVRDYGLKIKGQKWSLDSFCTVIVGDNDRSDYTDWEPYYFKNVTWTGKKLTPKPKKVLFHGISLIEGEDIKNLNRSSNMVRAKFYVCPVCGNVIQTTGEAVVSCCGITLPPLEAESADAQHAIRRQIAEDEYYVSVDHPMTKDHYISFLAAVSDQGIQLTKLYPEGPAEARFKIDCVRKIYAYCNRHGLFQLRD